MLIPDHKTVAIMAAIVFQAQENKNDGDPEIDAATTALSLWWAVEQEIDDYIRLDAEDKATRS